MSDWNKKEEWRKRGSTFLVTVEHFMTTHEERGDYFERRGPNHWCVYAYIYPRHPKFESLVGCNISHDWFSELPLHGGCSLVRKHCDESGNIMSYQFGADYGHLHDERYSFLEAEDEAHVVFDDAQALFDRLLKIEAEQVNASAGAGTESL